MAEGIGNAVGVFEEVDSRNGFLFWGASLRIRVRIDLSRPIRRGIHIYSDGPLSGLWVSFRYERLSELCGFCGIIGLASRDCDRLIRSDFGAGDEFSDAIRGMA